MYIDDFTKVPLSSFLRSVACDYLHFISASREKSNQIKDIKEIIMLE